jgi:nucleoside-diphosphate-sugar epimerase
MGRILITGGSGFIGTHLVESLASKGYKILNIDIKKPFLESHMPYWRECDILNYNQLKAEFNIFRPTHVVHLAAETRANCRSLEAYQANTVGTYNLLKVVKGNQDISRVIVTSSQHVRKPGSGLPKHDQDFDPYKLYGQSKVITERLTRDANLRCTWTIIRPTTIWGPWHLGLATGFWRVVIDGKYIHPRNDKVIRGYGYVKNTVYQIEKILDADSEIVNGKVFYLGDTCSRQIEWVNGFSKGLTKKNICEVPQLLIYLLAIIGESLNLFGLRFPMNISRYINMTTTNPVPIDLTIELFGEPPILFEQGVAETVNWLEKEGFI